MPSKLSHGLLSYYHNRAQHIVEQHVVQMFDAAESAEEPTMPDSSTLPVFRLQGVTKRGMVQQRSKNK